jgi:hypothetical protein
MTPDEWISSAIEQTNKELTNHSDYERAYHDLRLRVQAVGDPSNWHFGDVSKLEYNKTPLDGESYE